MTTLATLNATLATKTGEKTTATTNLDAWAAQGALDDAAAAGAALAMVDAALENADKRNNEAMM